MAKSLPEHNYIKNEDDEWLTRVVVDNYLNKFYIYSSGGQTKVVDCDNDNQFNNVLEMIQSVVDEKIVAYAEPPIKNGL